MIYNEVKHLITIKKNKNLKCYDQERAISSENDKRNVKQFLFAFNTEFVLNKIQYLNATFSGGHDEGGYDSFNYLDKDKEEIKIKTKENKWYTVRTLVKRRYLNKKDIETKFDILYYDEEKVSNLIDINLENIFYALGALDRFGSFAGEFSVEGDVLLDVITGKYHLSGSESLEEYIPFSEDGSVSEAQQKEDNATI